MFSFSQLKDYIIEKFLQCKHKHTSFPVTLKNEFNGEKDMLVTCLDCGKKFDYDWELMRICQ